MHRDVARAAVTTGGDAHGIDGSGRAGTTYWVTSTHTSTRRLGAALRPKWSPGEAPATSYGGTCYGLTAELLLGGKVEAGKEDEHVQERGELTLDACVCSAWTEEVGDGGNLPRGAAAGAREDEDGDGDSGRPAAIPRTRT